MSSEACRGALLAAARIACAFALVACGPKNPPESTAQPTSAPASTPAPEPAPDPALGVASIDLAACTATTSSAFSGSSAPSIIGADVVSCCQAIAAYYDGHALAGLADWKERTACCTALDWKGSATCTK